MLFYGISLIMKEKSNASALEVPYKLSTRGRDSRYLRPQFALPSAASSATFGRRQQIFSGNEMTLQT